MNDGELQQYLYDHIPQSEAMQAHGKDRRRLFTAERQLEANINHRDSVFGGSASSIAIIAAWSHLHMRIRAEGLDP